MLIFEVYHLLARLLTWNVDLFSLKNKKKSIFKTAAVVIDVLKVNKADIMFDRVYQHKQQDRS